MTHALEILIAVGLVLVILALGLWNFFIIVEGCTFSDFLEILGIKKTKKHDNE